MSTLATVKTDSDNFIGPKTIPTTWMLNSKYSRKVTTNSFDWSKIFRWGRQTSTSLWDWGITSSMQQKFLQEKKVYPSADTYNVARHGWTTQTASQGSWRSGPIKERDLCDSAALKYGQVWEFLCSSPIICKEEGGREFSTSCLCDL